MWRAGRVVDEDAVIRTLEEKRIAAATSCAKSRSRPIPEPIPEPDTGARYRGLIPGPDTGA
jgi:hypothetical protein